MSCTRCTPPVAPRVSGLLYLATPLAFTLGKIRAVLDGIPLAFTAPHPETVAVSLSQGEIAPLAAALQRALGTAELRDTRVVFAAAGGLPTVPEFMGGQSLAAFLAAHEGEWLAAMLRDDRLVAHFQPIVAADAPDRAFAYECLIRGTRPDGDLVPPGELFRAARETQLLHALDRAARTTIIRDADAAGIATALFVNFNPTAIYDPVHCLNTTVRAVAASSFTPDRVVFEVVESEETKDVGHLLRVLDRYRDAGFRIALDDMGTGYNSLTLLGKLRPDFVKLDRDAVRGVDGDPYRGQIVTKLLELARALGVRTIAEGIETGAEWRWLRDAGVDFMQGFLFARPAAAPPQPQWSPVGT